MESRPDNIQHAKRYSRSLAVLSALFRRQSVPQLVELFATPVFSWNYLACFASGLSRCRGQSDSLQDKIVMISIDTIAPR
jgi:hypothetical protein